MSARTATLSRSTKETKVQLSLSLDGGPLPFLPATTDFPDPNQPPSSTSASASGSHASPAPQSSVPDTTYRANRPIPPQSLETHASQHSASQQIWVWTGVGFLDHMLHAMAKHAGWSLRVRCRGDLIKDTFLALGSAFTSALGSRTGLRRFGHAYAPLDEALSRAVIDLSNRPFFIGNFDFKDAKIGDLSTQMIHHGLQSFSFNGGVTVHVDVLRGDNDHHRAESAFKALAVAIRSACERVEGREGEVVSTKGVL